MLGKYSLHVYTYIYIYTLLPTIRCFEDNQLLAIHCSQPREMVNVRDLTASVILDPTHIAAGN